MLRCFLIVGFILTISGVGVVLCLRSLFGVMSGVGDDLFLRKVTLGLFDEWMPHNLLLGFGLNVSEGYLDVPGVGSDVSGDFLFRQFLHLQFPLTGQEVKDEWQVSPQFVQKLWLHSRQKCCLVCHGNLCALQM
mmetsp:Transcript_62534/g.85935  ORF Transcript_62534/g.85935 Transcript_62534/m.85935 type:complete len:134 (+) Transcript_62534:333-734(+)